MHGPHRALELVVELNDSETVAVPLWLIATPRLSWDAKLLFSLLWAGAQPDGQRPGSRVLVADGVYLGMLARRLAWSEATLHKRLRELDRACLLVPTDALPLDGEPPRVRYALHDDGRDVRLSATPAAAAEPAAAEADVRTFTDWTDLMGLFFSRGRRWHVIREARPEGIGLYAFAPCGEPLVWTDGVGGLQQPLHTSVRRLRQSGQEICQLCINRLGLTVGREWSQLARRIDQRGRQGAGG